jgi:hypothetical protein
MSAASARPFKSLADAANDLAGIGSPTRWWQKAVHDPQTAGPTRPLLPFRPSLPTTESTR